MNLSELTSDAEPVDRELRCATGEQHDVQPLGHALQEVRQRRHDGLVVVDQVDVVEDQHRRVRMVALQRSHGFQQGTGRTDRRTVVGERSGQITQGRGHR
jgi:hypothetical protein